MVKKNGRRKKSVILSPVYGTNLEGQDAGLSLNKNRMQW